MAKLNMPKPEESNANKEWRLIEKLVLSMQAEQRKDRRWRIFFRLLGFAYLILMLTLFYPMRSGDSTSEPTEPHTAIVDVQGVIADSADGSIASADIITKSLRSAFAAKHAKAVLLRINSPGGSPVQSHYIFAEIMRLKSLHPEKKVYAVITEMGASGAYYVAAAADEIYVDPSSIVGSIGVIMAGFGFEEAINKLGIERRVLTSGENKALMDPFAPLNEAQKAHFQSMLDDVHQEFINAVKQGRGDRINADEQVDLFSGLVWSGQRAVELGLADGFGSPGSVARDIIKTEKVANYTEKPNPFERWLKGFGVSVGHGIASSLNLNNQLQ